MCEAGQNHTLLLNALGQVFSFGAGLHGQLGIGKQLLNNWAPTEVKLPSKISNGNN